MGRVFGLSQSLREHHEGCILHTAGNSQAAHDGSTYLFILHSILDGSEAKHWLFQALGSARARKAPGVLFSILLMGLPEANLFFE